MINVRHLLLFLFAFFWCNYSLATASQVPLTKIHYQNSILTIENKSSEPINLQNAELSFFLQGQLESIQPTENIGFEPTIKTAILKDKPHNQGNLFKIKFQKLQPSILLPQQKLQFRLTSNNSAILQNFNLNLKVPVVVPVKVTVDPAGWTQTIRICNTTAQAIPLKSLEFSFNFAGTINGIWGAPWLDWKVASRQGNQYNLTGGTPWSSPLQPDPSCRTPITIQFSSSPTTPLPTGPFVFKAEGAQPTGGGSVNVTLPTAPFSGAANPTVKVQGSNFNQQKEVIWGQSWKLDNLIPGSYTISATQITDGSAFYEASPVIVSVQDGQTAQATLSYHAVATTNVSVTLNNAPGPVPVTFAGAKYTINKTLSNGASIALPSDTYNVSATLSGHSATITPNPLVVPTNTALTISFQVSNVSAKFGAYFQSWSSRWSSDPARSDLARLPSYVNYVYLSFAKPDAVYQKGSMNYQSVGLQFNYESGNFLRDAIAALHRAQPNTKVLLAIGGATYNNWDGLNTQAIANFVADFGLDGVDIDYEAASPGCVKGSDGLIRCQIDTKYQNIVKGLRAALPRPYLISSTAWSISAYGQDQWSNATPQGEFTGMMLPFFRSAAVNDIDYVNVMSYDASDAYDPKQATAAFNNYYRGPVYMGVEVPPEAWGGHVYTLAEVRSLTQAVVAAATQKRTPAGMMLWSLQKMPNGVPSATNPSAQMMSTTICTELGLSNCNDPLFPN